MIFYWYCCQHGTCPVCRKDLTGEDTSQREYIQPPPGTADVESAMDAGVSPDGGDRPANSTVTSSNSNKSNYELIQHYKFLKIFRKKIWIKFRY